MGRVSSLCDSTIECFLNGIFEIVEDIVANLVVAGTFVVP